MSAGREAAVVALLCALLYLAGLAAIPFYTRGEPREGLVAREMLATGEWLVPARPGGEIARKPPLYYWLAAASLRALPREPELALRLPSALLATGGVLVAWGLARLAIGPAAALPTALVLATAFEWMRAATAARVDMALAAPLALVLAGLALAPARAGASAIVAAAGAALGVLGKGPVALVLPALAVGAAAVARRETWLARRVALPALLGAAVVGGTWYVVAYLRAGTPFLETVLRENWFRFVDPDARTGHVHAPAYLVGLGLVGLLPWTPLVPLAVAYALRSGRGPAAALAIAWIASGLVFFSLAAAKRSVYLLPLEPAVALLIGAGAATAPGERRLMAVARAGGYLYAPALLLLSGTAMLLGAGVDLGTPVRPFLRPDDALAAARLVRAARDGAPALFLLAAVTLVAIPPVRGAVRANAWRRVVLLIGILTVAWTSGFQVLLHPALARARSLRPFFTRLDRLVPATAPLYAFFPPDPGLRFYAPRDLRRWPPGAVGMEPVHLLVWEDEWRRLRDAQRRPLRPLAVSRARQAGHGRLVLVAVPPGPLLPPEQRRLREPESERIVDAGEHGRAFRPASDVDEPHDLRPHDAAEAEPVDEVQVGQR